MRFALMTEPQQGLTYDEQLAIVRRAEAAGFETFFRSDHYQSFPGPTGRPTTDAWTVLAGLARDTERIGLGVLVSPVTFRQTGNLAKVITTVDHMSGGRVEFGLGAGWNDAEHAQLGLPFPPIEERGDLLEESLQVVLGLWGEPDGWSFEGKHLQIRDAQFYPKPVDAPGRPRLPNGAARPWLLIGGGGTPRSMRIAARYADEFNLSSSSPAVAAQKFAALTAACEAIGRDPAFDRPLDDVGRADRAGRGRGQAATARAARAPSAMPTPARSGSRSGRSGGCSGRAIRPGPRSSGSPRPACPGSCSRTSSRATSITSTRWPSSCSSRAARAGPPVAARGPPAARVRWRLLHQVNVMRPDEVLQQPRLFATSTNGAAMCHEPNATSPAVRDAHRPRRQRVAHVHPTHNVRAGEGWAARTLPRRPRQPRSARRRGGSGPGSCRGRGRGARSGAGAASPCPAARRPARATTAPPRRSGGRPA